MANITFAHYNGPKPLKITGIKFDHVVAIREYAASIDYDKNPTREGFEGILRFAEEQLHLRLVPASDFLKDSPLTAGTAVANTAPSDSSSQTPSRDSLIERYGRALEKRVWFG